MNHLWRARHTLCVAGALAGSLLTLSLLAQQTTQHGDAGLERGRGLYVVRRTAKGATGPKAMKWIAWTSCL